MDDWQLAQRERHKAWCSRLLWSQCAYTGNAIAGLERRKAVIRAATPVKRARETSCSFLDSQLAISN